MADQPTGRVQQHCTTCGSPCAQFDHTDRSPCPQWHAQPQPTTPLQPLTERQALDHVIYQEAR